ncbi:MAG TPA: ExeM/NucH family extracellular endonuclease [Anaerolineaceae bacterium]
MDVKRSLFRLLAATVIVSMALALLPVQLAAQAAPTDLFFSEYIEGSSNNKALEIFNGTGADIDLSAGAYSVQMFFNGSVSAGLNLNLTGTVAAGDVYVVAHALADAAILAQADQTNNAGWFNGDDAVVLRKGAIVIDSIGQVGFDPGTEWGTGLTSTADNTLRRSEAVEVGDAATEDAFDPTLEWVGFANNTFDGLGVHTFTPPVGDTAPAVTGSVPANGATDVDAAADLVVNFSEDVTLADGWFSLVCSTSGTLTGVTSGGPASYTINPDADFAPGESCTLTVLADHVADVDVDDPPDALAADFTASFSVYLPVDTCALTITPIYAIQGSGATAAILGNVRTRGVVVGDYEGPSPTLRGFYLQDATGDGDLATSDGIFVFNSSKNNVAVGDVVSVEGSVSEYQGQTQITASDVTNCGTGTVTPVDVTLPFAAADEPERYEGMLVRLPQTLYVTEFFQLGRFGQVVLSSGGRLQQPTNVTTPGAEAIALQNANNLNRIIIDDATNAQNPDPIVFGRGGLPLSASNTLRGGDTATGIVGVLNYTWGGNSASPNAYRVRPVNALNGYVMFDAVNQRPAGAPEKTGSVRVAGMNLLNFFNSFDSCYPGNVKGDCRGASDQAEFDRQVAKTVAAIVGTQADVIGLVEVENDDYGPNSALAALTNALNAATAPGTYAYIDVDGAVGQDHALGTDAIKVAFVYKPAVVAPVGQTAVLNSEAFVNGGDGDARNRPALAQAFQDANGGTVVVSVNHLKSKGSACNAPDANDGQGNCNAVRTAAATLLGQWLASDPTGTGETDALIVGDLNSYANEDPIVALEGLGYTNLVKLLLGPDAYSYVFDGQWGYLDHALASASLVSQVTGVAEWHINADEPSVLDYLLDYKSPGQQVSLYAPDEFRISDHDPVLVDLDLDAPPTVDAGGPYSVDEGGLVTLSAAGADPNGAEGLTFVWDLDGDGVFETAGQSVEFAGVDGPAEVAVSVQVTDPTGFTALDEAVVTVNNVVPVVGAVSVTPEPSKEREKITATASFMDIALDAPFTCTVDYGAGSGPLAGTVSGSTCVGPQYAYKTYGVYTVTVTVTDKDGGVGSISSQHAVTMNFSGFYLPIVKPPFFNLAKAGSPFPVVFSLDGNKGLNIFAGGAPMVQRVSCITGKPTGAAPVVANGKLSYSRLTGLYTFLWKTEKSWGNTCQALVVRFVDDTEYAANFYLYK